MVDVWRVPCKYCKRHIEIRRDDALDVFGVRTYENVFDAIVPESEQAAEIARLNDEVERLKCASQAVGETDYLLNKR